MQSRLRVSWPNPRAAALMAVLLLLAAGLWARYLTWGATTPLRFVPDLSAAWHWGQFADQVGYLNVYGRVMAERPSGDYLLDYVPLRLAVCQLWVHAQRWSGRPFVWPPDWATARPLLWFHTLMELAAAAGAFALVRYWLRRAERPPGRLPVWGLALAAAAALWLNPALWINSHGRPGTDVWILPFYLWALLAAVANRWTVAGLIVATGAMLKGQQLVVAPLFVLWPLFARQPAAALRWLIGLLLGIALWVSPWMLSHADAAGRAIDWAAVAWCVAATLGTAWAVRRSPAPWRRLAPLAALALALLLCMPLFGAETAWYEVGPRYGASKYSHDLSVGGALGLAALLEARCGWLANDLLGPAAWGVTIRHALFGLYVAMLALSAHTLARLHRHRDPRFLAAIALPWLVWFAFAAQIHERYLLFGAGVGCLALAVHGGAFMLAVCFSLLSLLMTIGEVGGPQNTQFLVGVFGPGFPAELRLFIRGLYPDAAWVVIFGTLALLYMVRRAARGARATGG